MNRWNTWNIVRVGLLLLGAVGMLASTGCARFNTYRGVENLWRAEDLPTFTSGKTTQTDVMKALGPPSQIISLNKGSVFYYLREHGKGGALILLVYNKVKYDVSYDRSIFFFDDDAVLTDYAYSHLPPEKGEKADEKVSKKSQ